MSDSTPNPRDEILTLIRRSLAETATLQVICARLLAEVAALDKSPHDKLSAIIASIQGMVHSVALMSEVSGKPETQGMSQAVTEVAEQVCLMAESSLRAALPPPTEP